MTLKRLHELSTSQISAELGKAGIQGDFNESEAIVRLTIFLVGIGEDPFTFLFTPDIATEIVSDTEDSILLDCEFANAISENIPELVAGVLVANLADDVSAGDSSTLEVGTEDAITEGFEAGNEALEDELKLNPTVSLFLCVFPGATRFTRALSENCSSLPISALVISSESNLLPMKVLSRIPVHGGNDDNFLDDVNLETNEARQEWRPPDTVFLDENV